MCLWQVSHWTEMISSHCIRDHSFLSKNSFGQHVWKGWLKKLGTLVKDGGTKNSGRFGGKQENGGREEITRFL